MVCEEGAGEAECVDAPASGAEQQCQQFGVGERGRTDVLEAFAGTVVGGSHACSPRDRGHTS